MPLVVGVQVVRTHHDLCDHLRVVVGVTTREVARSTVRHDDSAEVEDDRVHLEPLALLGEFLRLAAADEGLRVGRFHPLREPADGARTGCLRKEREFIEVFSEQLFPLPFGHQPDEHGSLLLACSLERSVSRQLDDPLNYSAAGMAVMFFMLET